MKENKGGYYMEVKKILTKAYERLEATVKEL